MAQSKNRPMLRVGLPLAVTVGIFFLFFRGVPPARLAEAFASLTAAGIGLFVLLSLAGTVVRMQRFSLLLSGRVPKPKLFLITLVYNFSVDLLPARSAALGFYSYFTHREGAGWEEGAGSFVNAIVYDVLAVSVLLAPALFLLGGGAVRPWAMAAGLLLLFLGSVVFLLWAPAVLGWASSRLSCSWPKTAAVLARGAGYFRSQRGAGRRLSLFGLSLAIKFVKYLSIYVLIRDLVPGLPLLSGFFVFSFGVAAAEVSAYLPVQGLAGFGTWEAAFAFAVGRLHLPVADPMLIALVVHLTTQAWEYGIGLLAFLTLSLKKRKKES